MPGGGPVVTGPVGSAGHYGAVPGWTRHLLWKPRLASASGRCHQSWSPFANTCWSDVPHPTPTALHGWDPCRRHGGQQAWVFPCWSQQTPQETCSTVRVSS